MFSDPRVSELALRRAAVEERIARRRLECAEAFREAARPLQWIDRGRERWHRLSPWIRMSAVPVGLMLARTVVGHRRGVGRLVRWLPVAASLARTALTFYRPHRQSSRSPQPPVFPS